MARLAKPENPRKIQRLQRHQGERRWEYSILSPGGPERGEPGRKSGGDRERGKQTATTWSPIGKGASRGLGCQPWASSDSLAPPSRGPISLYRKKRSQRERDPEG